MAVGEGVHADSEKSIRRYSQQLGLAYGMAWRNDLLQNTAELKPTDRPTWHRCVLYTLKKFEGYPTFSQQILFSAETKQNCRIWHEKHPKEIHELSHEKIMIWYGLWSAGIIGLDFFNNNASENVTENGAIITDYLISEMETRNLGAIWLYHESWKIWLNGWLI